MKRHVEFANNQLNQLPMAISGIFYNVLFNGTRMPFFGQLVVRTT